MGADIAVNGGLSLNELGLVTGGCMTRDSGGTSSAAGAVGAGVLVGATIGLAVLGVVVVGAAVGALIGGALK